MTHRPHWYAPFATFLWKIAAKLHQVSSMFETLQFVSRRNCIEVAGSSYTRDLKLQRGCNKYCTENRDKIASKIASVNGSLWFVKKGGCNHPYVMIRRSYKQRLKRRSTTICVKPWMLRRDDQGAYGNFRSGTWTRRSSFSKVHAAPTLTSSETATSSPATAVAVLILPT